ncbi:OsmC family protein [Sphingomonas morindae]|uniref:OsmC family protein n=1 Tax=Sphingomonas morindae TaxID=1541170 RepID=A0ABY4XDI9_9SPHN|nr:OsmC family protein [Sphingomonas morindae]USI75000.1 OsmC family protein [Sphingomonas morindae]
MAERTHDYAVTISWTGNQGTGTSGPRAYARAHSITAPGKPAIPGSSDPAFAGDPTRWNPEELLLAAVAACHKLWYLGLCAGQGVIVLDYRDTAEARMIEEADGGGQFVGAVLRPAITLAPGSDLSHAAALHAEAHRLCFIARSLAFPVTVEPEIRLATA